MVGIDLNRRSADKIQDGPATDIVCEACELLFAESDKYAATIFRKNKRPKSLQITRIYIELDEYLIYAGVDPIRILHFILSILLRQYLYQLQKGVDPTIDSSTYEKVRAIYIENKPDFLTFPCQISFLSGGSSRENNKGVLFPVHFNSNCLVFTGASYAFFIHLASPKVDEPLVLLNLTNKIYVRVQSFESLPIYNELRAHAPFLTDKTNLKRTKIIPLS